MVFATADEAGAWSIQQAHLDGSNKTLLYTLPGQPRGLALDTATNKYVLRIGVCTVYFLGPWS